MFFNNFFLCYAKEIYSWLKILVIAVACACAGSYTVAGAQGTFDVKARSAKPVVCRTGPA